MMLLALTPKSRVQTVSCIKFRQSIPQDRKQNTVPSYHGTNKWLSWYKQIVNCKGGRMIRHTPCCSHAVATAAY
jgi:hypothetical protein